MKQLQFYACNFLTGIINNEIARKYSIQSNTLNILTSFTDLLLAKKMTVVAVSNTDNIKSTYLVLQLFRHFLSVQAGPVAQLVQYLVVPPHLVGLRDQVDPAIQSIHSDLPNPSYPLDLQILEIRYCQCCPARRRGQ